jgi:hypothetical protein
MMTTAKWEMVNKLRAFIEERHLIYLRKEAGLMKPWTKDPIMRMYRFCNICREWDTETRWISEYWRTPHKDDKDLWFAMLVARVFNWRETLNDIGYPVPWTEKYRRNLLEDVDRRMRTGQKVWTGAYIVSTNGHREAKHDYFVNRVFEPAWAAREQIRPVQGDTLESFAKRLITLNGLSHFMTGQIVADVKFTGPLLDAEDWATWCVPGPGSTRGMNRIYGFELDAKWNKDVFRGAVNDLIEEMDYRVGGPPRPPECLSAQDLQNCLCEFDKYERVRLGEGRPRSLYNGG